MEKVPPEILISISLICVLMIFSIQARHAISKLVLLNASVLDLNKLKTIWTEISAVAYMGVSFFMVVSQKINFAFYVWQHILERLRKHFKSFNSAISKYVGGFHVTLLLP